MFVTTPGASSAARRTPDRSSRETRPRGWLPNALAPHERLLNPKGERFIAQKKPTVNLTKSKDNKQHYEDKSNYPSSLYKVVTGQKFLLFPVALPLCDTMEEVSANLKDAIEG